MGDSIIKRNSLREASHERTTERECAGDKCIDPIGAIPGHECALQRLDESENGEQKNQGWFCSE